MASIESSRSEPGAYTATEIGPFHLQGDQLVGLGHHEYHLPVQQGFQVVKKREVPMSGVGYSFVAVELFASSDVVVEDPVVSSHTLAEVGWLVVTLDRVRDGEGWAALETLGWGLAGGSLRLEI